MVPELLYRLRFLSDLTEGPRGPLFTVTEIEEGNPPAYRTRLAEWGPQGLRFLTQGEAQSPAWHGESIYFIRKVEGVPQLFRLPRQGEAEQLTRLPAGVEAYRLGSRGEIALLSRGAWKAPEAGSPRAYTRWPFKRDARGLLPEVPRQLWLLEETPRLLVEHSEEIEEIAWLPGGEGLLWTAPGSDEERRHWKARVYKVDRSGTVEELFGGEGPVSDLLPTETGLYYLAHAHEREGGTEPKLYYRPWGGEPQLLARGAFGNSLNSDSRYGSYFQGLRLGPEGALYALRTERGQARLFRLQGGREESLALPGSVVAYAFVGNALYTLSESFLYPPRLEREGTVLWDPNQELLGEAAAPEPLSWQSPEGHSVEGWVLLPPGKGPHPAILAVHGGPHTAYGEAFLFEFQLYRALGLAVIFANPRGSTGYGEDFACLGGAWGELDEADLTGFLEEALRRFPLDAGRLGVTGGSYGGFMTNWLTGRYPERFRAAVTDRSIASWPSFFGASDIGPRFSWLELATSPWQHPERLWEKSPLRWVHRVRTPTLVVHSEEDHRCPIDQGETWFTALQELGVTSRFLRVPGEGHELSRSGRPDRRLRRLEEYLAWWRAHLLA
jgi:dipeptidyl aminopeptidase/acylaminoacyl peptidase